MGFFLSLLVRVSTLLVVPLACSISGVALLVLSCSGFSKSLSEKLLQALPSRVLGLVACLVPCNLA